MKNLSISTISTILYLYLSIYLSVYLYLVQEEPRLPRHGHGVLVRVPRAAEDLIDKYK